MDTTITADFAASMSFATRMECPSFRYEMSEMLRERSKSLSADYDISIRDMVIRTPADASAVGTFVNRAMDYYETAAIIQIIMGEEDSVDDIWWNDRWILFRIIINVKKNLAGAAVRCTNHSIKSAGVALKAHYIEDINDFSYIEPNLGWEDVDSIATALAPTAYMSERQSYECDRFTEESYTFALIALRTWSDDLETKVLTGLDSGVDTYCSYIGWLILALEMRVAEGEFTSP